MKITYIGHSGFLLELEKSILLFDYYQGEIPALPPEKPLYIFVSHKHRDHFNPQIFSWKERYPQPITYGISYDVKKRNLPEMEGIYSLQANQQYTIDGLEIETLKSTDAGVAFLVKTEGKTIYHSGDLNWWYWEGESKQYNNNMTANYQREIRKLTDVSIDVAFVPLDPRQEESYWMGLDYFLKKVACAQVFPMHFWEDYDCINRFFQEGHGNGNDTNVMRIKYPGQCWEE